MDQINLALFYDDQNLLIKRELNGVEISLSEDVDIREVVSITTYRQMTVERFKKLYGV